MHYGKIFLSEQSDGLRVLSTVLIWEFRVTFHAVMLKFLILLSLRLSCGFSDAIEYHSDHVCGVRPFVNQEPQRLRHERTKRLIGGEGAGVGEFPWQAALGIFSASGNFDTFCGGALVHAHWILTAAHCIRMFDQDVTMQNKKMIVRLGMTDRYNSTTYLDAQPSERIVHEAFDLSRRGQDDIALLKLAEPVPLSPYIFPVCIAPYMNYNGSIGTLAGWGSLYQGGPRPQVLQKIRVPFMDNNICQLWFPKSTDARITADLICSVNYMDWDGGRGACVGDSGSPVVQEMDGRWNVVGIVSSIHLTSCMGPYFSGLTTYAFVPHFADWIKQKTHGEVYLPDFSP